MTTALSRPTPPMVSTVERPGAATVRQPYPGRAATRRRSRRPRRRSGPASASRSWWRSGSSGPTDADPLDVYRVLRATNPSPYMYLLRFDGFDIVGSSPEAHLKVSTEDGAAGRCCTRSPAPGGAAPRPEEDAALAAELLADPKERAEHVMLVDLGRNDLGRVCKPGTVEVPEFATIERYSHVMHIVSTVVGELRDDQTRVRRAGRDVPGRHAVRRARRCGRWRSSRSWSRPGAASTAASSATSASAATWTWRSRSAPRCCATGVAYVQAGAGIVADSDPAAEEQETRNKAAAVLAAIAAAETLRGRAVTTAAGDRRRALLRRLGGSRCTRPPARGTRS